MELNSTEQQALANWMDRLPSLPHITPADGAAVDRGRALFENPAVGCATCHSGIALTNNASVDVGTGGPVQVPSLRGVRWPAPYMHTGCAATLADRFDPACGGGEAHGHTAGLSDAQRADLVAYLETL
jgi:mono/diheme cytochrome c family protein